MKYISKNESSFGYLKAIFLAVIFSLFHMGTLHAQVKNLEHRSVDQKLVKSKRISSRNAKAAAPYLTTDSKGRAVISWIEEKDHTLMYYAVLNEDGGLYRGPTPIPPTKGLNIHHEMMSKMVFKPDGEIIAVWPVDNETPENKYGGLIYYAQSFDGGDTWTDPIPITTDTASNDQRYFDLAVLKNGNAAIVWLDNRSEYETEGSTLFYASTKGKDGFQNEKIIGRSTCQCCRTDIHVDDSGNISVAYRNIFNKKVRDMAYTVSHNGGKDFSEPKRISYDNWEISGCPHTGPSMTSNKNGLHFYWYTMGGGEGVYFTSTNNYGKHFKERKLFSEDARHPQAGVLNDGTIAVVWDELSKAEGEFNNRIGLALRKENKDIGKTIFLTSPIVHATYPVVLGLENGALLVAWSQEKNKSKEVYYISIDNPKAIAN
jgi:hypothetical protein